MTVDTVDDLFRRFRTRGDPGDLARVFDALAPELYVVARHATGDPAEAEDCVQQAFVRAVEKAAVWDGDRPLRAWIGGILLGEVRNAVRHRRRRTAEPIDEAAIRVEADPADRAAEAEAAVLMARAAESLTPPYREVVLLRLRHDLDPVEIATVLDRPYETVRIQLRRALVALRARLPRGLALGGAVLTEAGAGPGTLAEPRRQVLVAARRLLAPVLLVAGHVKATLLGSVALLALLGLGWWAMAVPEVAPEGANAPERIGADTTSGGDTTMDSRDLRSQVTSDAVADAADISPSAMPLGGRVVAAADDTPIPGAVIVVSHCDADRFVCLDPEYRWRVQEIARATTDARGEFAVDVDPGRLFRVEIRAAGFAARRFADRAVGAGQVFVMDRAIRVPVSVVDADTDAPIEAAAITVYHDGLQGIAIRAKTDVAGRAVLAGAAPVKVTVHAALRGYGDGYRYGVDLGESGGEPIEIRLERQEPQEHVVLDALTGRPIPHALVQLQGSLGVPADGAAELRTDSAGRFRAVLGDDPFHVIAPGYARWPRRGAVDDEGPQPILLDPGAAFTGRVVTDEGVPLPDAYVAALAQVDVRRGVSVDWITGSIDASGRFVVEGLREGFVYDVHLRKPGYGARLVRLPRPVAGARTDVGDLALVPAGVLHGRLVDDSGLALPDVRLSLHGADDRAGALVDGVRPVDVQHCVIGFGRGATTDSAGRFRFPDLAAGSYRLDAHVGPRNQRSRGPFLVEDGAVADVGDVVMSLGRTVTGAVVGPDGPIDGVSELQLIAMLPGEGPRSHRVRIDGGRYTLAGLRGGAMLLVAESRLPGLALPPTELDEGGAEVDLRFVRSLPIEGRVFDRDGEPVRARVHAYRSTPRVGVSFGVETDAEGRFRIDVDPAFAGRLTAGPPDAYPMEYGSVDDVTAGMTDVVIRLP